MFCSMLPTNSFESRIPIRQNWLLYTMRTTPSELNMPDSEPQGCLAVILSLLGIRPHGAAPASEQLPYRQRDDFLSAAELSFYRVLTLGLDGTYLVCPKVNLADIFFVSGSNKKQSYKNKIDRKHVDFLLCDPTSMTPILGVELDDESHGRRDRQDRDQFVDQVFEVAGLPLLHVRAAAGYSPQNIANLIREAVANPASSEKVIERHEGTPLCPNCGTQMVIRTAKKGNQKGEEFWGCRNYPKCREIVKV